MDLRVASQSELYKVQGRRSVVAMASMTIGKYNMGPWETSGKLPHVGTIGTGDSSATGGEELPRIALSSAARLAGDIGT